MRTTDQADMFSGSPDRCDCQLIGKSEMYVPYHSYDLARPDVNAEELITPGHLYQDKTRNELHRVWEFIAKLSREERTRHTYWGH